MIVYFFNDLVVCSECGHETLGIVEEFSAQVICDRCEHPIINADGAEDVVIFTMDKITVQ